MKETQIADIWTLFREYVDKKSLDIVAEKYVDLLADYGIDDVVLKKSMGVDSDLDNAICYYLDIDDESDDKDWD